MSPFRAALLAFGYGEWAVQPDGTLVRVARVAPLRLASSPPFWVLIMMLALAPPAAADEPPKVRVRAAICQDKGCVKTALVAFGPVAVRVTYSVEIRPENRLLKIGLVCTNGAEYLSDVQLNGNRMDDPQFYVRYPDIDPGECEAMATVRRKDGSWTPIQRSERLTVKGRFDDEDAGARTGDIP